MVVFLQFNNYLFINEKIEKGFTNNFFFKLKWKINLLFKWNFFLLESSRKSALVILFGMTCSKFIKYIVSTTDNKIALLRKNQILSSYSSLLHSYIRKDSY